MSTEFLFTTSRVVWTGSCVNCTQTTPACVIARAGPLDGALPRMLARSKEMMLRMDRFEVACYEPRELCLYTFFSPNLLENRCNRAKKDFGYEVQW